MAARGRPFPKGVSGNPAGRPPSADQHPAPLSLPNTWRLDAWTNTTTGFGTTRDSRTTTSFEARLIGVEECRRLWKSNDLAATGIDAVVLDALAKGFEISCGEGGKESSEAAHALLEDLEALDKIKEARQLARALGGAALYPVCNDGSADLAMPLREENISEITAIHVFECTELQPDTYYEDLNHPKYGQPQTWWLQPQAGHRFGSNRTRIHESRLIIFQGIRVAKDDRASLYPGWGDSVFERCEPVLRDNGIGWDSAAILLQDYSPAVFKIAKLGDLLAHGGTAFQNRLIAADMGRSTLRATVIDAELEDFKRETTPVLGLADLLDRFMYRLAAAFGMPVTRLWGKAASGMNATGEGDAESWYATCDRERGVMQKSIERLVKLVLLALEGNEPDTWSVTWPALSQPTEKEVEEQRKITADRDAIYLDRGVVTADEVRKARFGGDTYSTDLVIEDDEEPSDDDVEDYAATLGPDGKPLPPEKLGPDGKPLPAPVGADGNPLPMTPSGGVDVAKTAFTGVQVTSLIEIVKAVVGKEIPRESGAAILQLAFPLDEKAAETLLGPENFEPPKPEPPIIAGLPGAKPPGAPGAKPSPFGGAPAPAGEKPEIDPKPGASDPA